MLGWFTFSVYVPEVNLMPLDRKLNNYTDNTCHQVLLKNIMANFREEKYRNNAKP